jgi:hypothetical protein
VFDLHRLALMTDVSAAAWVEEALARWPEGSGFPVSSLIPARFGAYARILHPTSRVEDEVGTGTWAELAAERGKQMHPLVQFEALVDGRGPEETPDWDDLVPLEELPEREANALAVLLTRFTGTPEVCWFALWEGYGSFGPTFDRSDTEPGPHGRPVPTAEARSRARAFQVQLDRFPRVRTLMTWTERSSAGREYLLLRGPVDAIGGFQFDVWWQPPNMWWPDDRAWFVATEVDGYDSFVGGSRACIDAVLGSSDLEAFPIGIDDRLGPVDPLNPAPWDRKDEV